LPRSRQALHEATASDANFRKDARFSAPDYLTTGSVRKCGTFAKDSAFPRMRIFIGFTIAAVALFFADQHFAFGYYTDKTMMMLQHITRSFRP
jgi:hypothetical protein